VVQHLCEVVAEYEKSLQEMSFLPQTSYGRTMLQEHSGPNKIFLTHLFCDHDIAIQFLKDMGLLQSKAQFNTCGRDMTLSAQPNIPEGFSW
jgi:hypothetical protein